MMRPSRLMRRHHTRRRRGTAYVLALSITSMLIVLGITATQIARGAIEENELEHDQAEARTAALYAQDYIHKFLDGNTSWRANAPNANWSYFAQLHDVTMFYAYVDQIDGDITNDPTQPFMLYTLAVKGESRRVYRVEVVPDADGNLTRNLDKFEQVAFEDL